jgi:plasmid replication initiation protein
MIKKVVDTPSPLDPNNPKSFKLFSWFTDAEYIEKDQIIKISLHVEMVKRLAVFRQYTSLDYGMIFSLNNAYSLKVYLSCKIMLSRYKTNESIKLELDSFKHKIGLKGKYSKPSLFEKYVLLVVKDEIKNLTDINFDYELHKTGKRFTHITLKFSQKKNVSKQLDQSKRQPQEIEHQKADEPLDLDLNNQEMILSAQLFSYGIPRSKASEYVRGYGVDACKVGIEKLLGEIQKGRDIKNISGYLISCIESSANNKSSKEIKAAMNLAEELEQDRKAQEMERFYSFDTYINNNEQQILVLLARNESQEKLTDELEIDMLRCLKDVIAQYEDLESISPYYS